MPARQSKILLRERLKRREKTSQARQRSRREEVARRRAEDMLVVNAKRRRHGQAMARVLIPLPSRDFDPTESAVPWKVCSEPMLVDQPIESLSSTSFTPGADQAARSARLRS
jgi:hypothetical protein